MPLIHRACARRLVAVLVAGVLVSACGGGFDDAPRALGPAGAPQSAPGFTSVVSFGDSLSDVGTYTPATSLSGDGAAPYLGGKFTTNSASARIWVELVAASLGLAVTPAEVGFNGQSQPCPAAAAGPAAAATCTAYGQGGSRITDPAGIGKQADGSGALTVPVRSQIANHLARKGDFKAGDLVFVFAGNNDALVQFGAFAATASQINAQVAAGAITADQAQVQLLTAQVDADSAVKLAAMELSAAIRSDILGRGAVYVAVLNLPDSSATPFGLSLPSDAARGVLAGLVGTFNTALREGLDLAPVALLDAAAGQRAVIANPAAAGFTEVAVAACDAAIISAVTGGLVADGSSLFCNTDPTLPYQALRANANQDTWFFADGVHPSVGGHRTIAGFVGAELRRVGWLP